MDILVQECMTIFHAWDNELLNLVVKARHLSGSAFCLVGMGVPDKALGWFPEGKLSCMCTHILHL